MKVFIIEYDGCECGGAVEAAFATNEAAEKWIAANSTEKGYPLNNAIDGYTIYEVEVTE